VDVSFETQVKRWKGRGSFEFDLRLPIFSLEANRIELVFRPQLRKLMERKPKAPDLVRCPHCRQNHEVYIDREKNFQCGILKSQLVEYFVCTRCDRDFSKLALPIVFVGSLISGWACLAVWQVFTQLVF
jgi:DNA-directed RNA polymerase subunit RPC12/RpoP